MQGARIYSAPSLTEIINYLRLYRASGMLSIRPAVGTYREQALITIEFGHPVRIQRGMYEEDASEFSLRQLNAWGEIHFMFQVKTQLLQLPAPLQPPQQVQSRLSGHLIRSPQPHPNVSGTQPLPSIAFPADKIPAVSHRTRRSKVLKSSTPYAIPPEAVIPSLTPTARQYPVTNLSHHDRSIFLLINGQRTVADLISLTKRSLADIYNTLYILRDQQLIVMQQTLPGRK